MGDMLGIHSLDARTVMLKPANNLFWVQRVKDIVSVLKGNQGSKERHLCLICSQTLSSSSTDSHLSEWPTWYFLYKCVHLFVC